MSKSSERNFEAILQDNLQRLGRGETPFIIAHPTDPEAHLRRALEWTGQPPFTAVQEGRSIFLSMPNNRWQEDDFGYHAILYALIDDGAWRVVQIGPLSGVNRTDTVLDVDMFPDLGDPTWVGLFYEGTVTTARSTAIPLQVRHQLEPPVPPPPQPTKKGADWPINNGRAPIVVMTPEGTLGSDVWNRWLSMYFAVVRNPGWNGTHTPLQNGVFSTGFWELAQLNQFHNKITAVWIADQTESPTFVMSLTRQFINELTLQGIKSPVIIGPTFDVQERWSEAEVNDWVAETKRIAPSNVLVGARALPDKEYAGDFEAYEDHVNDIGDMDRVLLEEIARSEGDPIWNTERFRVRNNGEGKDWDEIDFPAAIRMLRARNVGAIFGIQDQRGSVSAFGSGPPTSFAILEGIRVALKAETPIGENMAIVDLKRFQTFRVSAIPGDDEETKWTKSLHWPRNQGDIKVRKRNDTKDTYIVYGIGIFTGIDGTKVDEITCEPRIAEQDKTSGHIFPSHISEKDHPTSGFEAYRYIALEPQVRVRPGDTFEGKFDHTQAENPPHGSITFFCYREN